MFTLTVIPVCIQTRAGGIRLFFANDSHLARLSEGLLWFASMLVESDFAVRFEI